MEVARVCIRSMCGTARTCHFDVKGEVQGVKSEDESTEAKCRDGPVRSSVEVSVMEMEQRDWVIQPY